MAFRDAATSRRSVGRCAGHRAPDQFPEHRHRDVRLRGRGKRVSRRGRREVEREFRAHLGVRVLARGCQQAVLRSGAPSGCQSPSSLQRVAFVLDVRGLMRTAAVLASVPALLFVSWMTRQAVLSGYPLFPLSTGGLPVDWRLPEPVLADANRWVRSWARTPGEPPQEVLANWDWLSGWTQARLTDLDLLGPAIAALCIGATVVLRRRTRRGQPSGIHVAAPIAVLISVGLTLVVWFVAAPEPRFVYAPLWIAPIAVLAWVLPDVSEPTGVQATALALGALALVTVGFIDWGRAYLPIRADGRGPFGAQEFDQPRVRRFVTVSGLRLWRPIGATNARRSDCAHPSPSGNSHSAEPHCGQDSVTSPLPH